MPAFRRADWRTSASATDARVSSFEKPVADLPSAACPPAQSHVSQFNTIAAKITPANRIACRMDTVSSPNGHRWIPVAVSSCSMASANATLRPGSLARLVRRSSGCYSSGQDQEYVRNHLQTVEKGLEGTTWRSRSAFALQRGPVRRRSASPWPAASRAAGIVRPEEIKQRDRWLHEHLLDATSCRVPFSFVYDGRTSDKLLAAWPKTNTDQETRRRSRATRHHVGRFLDGPGSPVCGRSVRRLSGSGVDGLLQERRQEEHADPTRHPRTGCGIRAKR